MVYKVLLYVSLLWGYPRVRGCNGMCSLGPAFYQSMQIIQIFPPWDTSMFRYELGLPFPGLCCVARLCVRSVPLWQHLLAFWEQSCSPEVCPYGSTVLKSSDENGKRRGVERKETEHQQQTFTGAFQRKALGWMLQNHRCPQVDLLAGAPWRSVQQELEMQVWTWEGCLEGCDPWRWALLAFRFFASEIPSLSS